MLMHLLICSPVVPHPPTLHPILQRGLKDKVANVVLNSLAGIQALMEGGGGAGGRDMASACEAFMPLLLDKLGDNNAKLRWWGRGRGGESNLCRAGVHPTLLALRPTPCTLRSWSCALHPAPYAFGPAPYTLGPAPYTLHPTLVALRPAPCALQSALHVLCRIPHCTLCPIRLYPIPLYPAFFSPVPLKP